MATLTRLRPNVVVRRIVRNQSSRHGVKPLLIVLHSTEGNNLPGIRDLEGLASWFDNPVAQASSHVGVDDEGQSSRMVTDAEKAWTCAFYNSVSLNIEMIGHAAQTSWTDDQVLEAARWIAQWHLKHGIPIRAGLVFNGRVVRSGVISHKRLGALGGGHVDPGAGFPRRKVRRLARQIADERKANR